MKYWLGSVEHLATLRTKDAFTTGTMIHDMIHRVNRARLRGRRWKLTEVQLMTIGLKRLLKAKGLSEDDLSLHQSKFIQWFALRKVSSLKPIGAEVGFSKVIYEDQWFQFIYEGRIDEIVRIGETGLVAWNDYKSRSREYAIYSNTNQFLGYSWALGTNYGFVSYYGLQKTLEPKEAFRVVSIFHPVELLEQWRQDTIQKFRQIALAMPFGKNGFERRRSSCATWNGDRCQFVRICDSPNASEVVIRGIKKTFFEKREWHPWREEYQEFLKLKEIE